MAQTAIRCAPGSPAAVKVTTDATTFVQKHGERMHYLYGRWLDERQYEDFKDYSDELKKLAVTWPDIEFTRAQKRPFGFVANYKPLNRPIEFLITARGCGWHLPKIGA